MSGIIEQIILLFNCFELCKALTSNPHRNMLVTVKHKLSWIDEVIEEWKAEFKSSSQATEELPRLIFVSHSFGAYLVQHLLLSRPVLLQQTQQIIHLMPFIRFDPPPLQKLMLSKLAHSYEYTIPMLSNSVWALSSTLPRKLIDIYLKNVIGLDCDKGRKITLDVCTHPRMVRNHLILGFEEIRELPELPNVSYFPKEYVFSVYDVSIYHTLSPVSIYKPIEKRT